MNSNGITYGGLKIHTAYNETGQPICIGDQSGETSIHKTVPGRSLEIYTEAGMIIGIRVTYFGDDIEEEPIIEAEIGDCPELDDPFGDDDQ
jgi:hypothetical protein